MEAFHVFVMIGLSTSFAMIERNKIGKISWAKITLSVFVAGISGILYYYLGYHDVESGVLGVFMTSLAWNHKWLREDKDKMARIVWYEIFVSGFLLLGMSLLEVLVELI